MKLTFIRQLTLITAVLFTFPSYALQIKIAVDNESIVAAISTDELTRIFVEGDKISSVVGVSGTYQLQNDEQQGAIFIKPSASYIAAAKRAKEIEKQAEETANATPSPEGEKKDEKATKEPEKKPVAKEKPKERHLPKLLNLFVATQSGHNYTLLLNPLNIQAETIMLKPKFSLSKSLSANNGGESSYQPSLVRLINAMVNRSVLDEYSISNFAPGKKPQYKLEKANLYLVSVYRGEDMRGEIYQMINKGKEEIAISEQQFYRNGVRAVALQDRIVPPDGETYVYIVIQ